MIHIKIKPQQFEIMKEKVSNRKIHTTMEHSFLTRLNDCYKTFVVMHPIKWRYLVLPILQLNINGIKMNYSVVSMVSSLLLNINVQSLIIVLLGITLDDLQSFIPRMLGRLYTDALMYGNITREVKK
jgi:hypothetical protein